MYLNPVRTSMKTQSVGSGDRSCHVCSNDRADYCSVFRKAAVCCLSLAQLVLFFRQASGHISGQSMVYTIFVFDMHTETVCVRIGCENQVCIDFFCKFQSQFESFFCFRVRITYRREIAVRQFLLFTTYTCSKPSSFKTRLAGILPVPCSGV